MKKPFYRLYIVIYVLLFIAACNKDDQQVLTGKAAIQFNHVVDGQSLVLTDKEFINAAGNKYNIEKLKYYVSKIRLTRADGDVFQLPDGYFLIEETGLSSRKQISIENIPAGQYTSLSFAIGVDSARNFSTEMVGELNPNNDMAWNWVSGYKFLLLEGKFTTNSNVTDAMVLHIGGNQSYRTVMINTANTGFSIQQNKTTTIELNADINKLFNTLHVIDLNTINAVMQPGENAGKIADNYAAGMFTLQNIRVE